MLPNKLGFFMLKKCMLSTVPTQSPGENSREKGSLVFRQMKIAPMGFFSRRSGFSGSSGGVARKNPFHSFPVKEAILF